VTQEFNNELERFVAPASRANGCGSIAAGKSLWSSLNPGYDVSMYRHLSRGFHHFLLEISLVLSASPNLAILEQGAEVLKTDSNV